MYFKSLVVAISLAASTLAANFTVMVGVNSTTTFTPPSLNANVGDIVDFVFVAQNHSVWQSTFADPCSLKSGGFTNDFQPVVANSTSGFPTIQLKVTQTLPIWFYCPQTHPANHCHKGMVGAINPTANMTFSDFQSKALALANATTTSTSNTTGSSSTSGNSPPASSPTTPASSGNTTSGTGSTGANGVPPLKSMMLTSTLLGVVASVMLTL